MAEGIVAVDDPRAPDVSRLLQRHLAFAASHSPPEDVHALGVDGLLDPSVTFFSYRVAGQLLGVGALKEIDLTHGELKSMHTAQEARQRGVGWSLVQHLLGVAGHRGYVRVSLETGSMDAFQPARALYAKAGFAPCEPFGEYFPSRNSTFMTLLLGETRLAAG
ncbi:MAG TPA: GNAT family N-acetyltransferase [Acidimicrobiales bacterium]|nr:GNAT family N-acetyltransferase [Acidimicrobiales bacterium]